MYIRELEEYLNKAKELSKKRRPDGGIEFKIHYLNSGEDIGIAAKKAHTNMRPRGYELKSLSKVSHRELVESLNEFILGATGKQNMGLPLVEILKIELGEIQAYEWSADFSGYGQAYVFAVTSLTGVVLVVSEWVLD